MNLIKFVGSDAAVVHIPNGVELAEIPVKDPVSDRKKPKFEAICVGRIVSQKNYKLLAAAIATLPENYQKRLSVDVFGEGDAQIVEDCEEILAGTHFAKCKMRFRGSTSEIRTILHKYDCFLMSSDWEGQPMALIEANAAGLPCIVTDVGGCKEIVESGPSGLVVEAGNVTAYRDAIIRLLDSPKVRNDFSHNALKVAQNYSIKKSADSHEKLYEEVLLLRRKNG